MMQLGTEQGVLAAEERSMVDGVMRLSELKASDAMTPRVDLVGVDLDDPPGKQLAAALSSPSIASSNNISDILGGTQNNASSATNDFSAILKAIQTAQKSGDTQKVNSELKLFIAQTQMNTLYGLQGSAGSSATSAQSLISLIA